MLDLGHLPSLTNCDVQIFPGNSVSTGQRDWQTWKFPRGCSMLQIICMAGGGSAGGGFTGTAGTARGGGGGGGGGAVSMAILPAYALPETLYIFAGQRKVGGAAGANGNLGILSLVAVAPDNTSDNVILYSGSAGSGGQAGTGATGGAGGAGGTVAVAANMPMIGSGLFSAIAGQAGTAGGAQTGANGTAITIPTTSAITQGGSGGGGTTSADFAGGACTSIANSWLSEHRAATPGAGSFNGSGGLQLWEPLFSFGGLGGSASNAGIGGFGGNGAYGSGGGGGGGGTTGGTGGDGGAGLVVMIAW